MPKVKIDGVEIEVPAGITVIQACELAGVDPWGVPRPSKLSLGVALAKLGLEVVRIETLGGVA